MFTIRAAKNISIFSVASPSTLSVTRIRASSKSSAANPRAPSISQIFFTTPFKAHWPANSRNGPAWTAFSSANSGAEAVEGALKLARLYGRTAADSPRSPARKHRILALENSFHGRTFGAVSVTATEKYRLPFAPLVPGVEFVRFNDVADLESKFDDTVCAILLETIQGEGGIYPVSEDFWNRARSLATKNGALLIADEIQCGLGRTGRYFAYQKFASKPDVVLIAKPLAAGLPLGAVLTSEAVAQRVSPGLHGTTFGGGPLACATALEFLSIVEDEKLLENIQRARR